ncbi:hypothetical protein GCM10023186_35160 [Hymenobacter koreensis]|uniref:Secreted protein n=1 Tax=Hymenobacter koreensis TaxID=1084523 RepID=A0ABP8JC97_9BACT
MTSPPRRRRGGLHAVTTAWLWELVSLDWVAAGYACPQVYTRARPLQQSDGGSSGLVKPSKKEKEQQAPGQRR